MAYVMYIRMRRESWQQAVTKSCVTARPVVQSCIRILATMAFVSAIFDSAQLLAADVDFNRDIRPILSNHCFQCHGPDEETREADLRLDSETSAKADRGDDSVIVAGRPDKSALVRRILSDDDDEVMPPPELGKKLTPKQVDLLRNWIQAGAKYQQHWAWVTPVRSELPKVNDLAWPVNWVDRYILARLEREQIAPSSAADRVTLLRRLSFDVTGLPPTPQEVDAFLSDQRSDAYSRVVDRMLASPAFGERMAIYWLDLVRYADTVGYHGDQDHAITPYRDYVIDAFNDNLPFDQFTREQLAGDLIPDATTSQKIATGYNRLLQTSHEGGVQRKEYLALYAADRVRNVSAVWMGATLGCAQCHDHKYDPFTAKDFYAMSAFFADVDEEGHFSKGNNSLPTNRPPEIKVMPRADRLRVEKIEKEILRLTDSCDPVYCEQQLEELRATAERLRAKRRRTMVTVSLTKPRLTRVLPRGNWLDDSGPVVDADVPSFMGSIATFSKRANGKSASRDDLAKWFTSIDGSGPHTARVFANRLWYLFFGQGISRSLDDFGGQGEPPEHPELLDALAWEFIDRDWDIKHMIRLMVTSRTYRQVSTTNAPLQRRDPENQLFARQSRFRLPAEMVRDNALFVSRLLVEQVGGVSVKPYQPAGYYRHLNFPTRKYESHTDCKQWRRGVYVHWQRQFLHPMLKAFDAPSREECSASRSKSNTPLAALVLLNDPTFVEAARVFAERIVRVGGATDDERIEFAYRNATSRVPDKFAREVLTNLLSNSRKHYRDNPKAASRLLQVGQAPANSEIDSIDQAAWTTIARAVLNLSDTITRN